MKIEEAIEVNDKVADYEICCWMPKALKANRLGNEALKYYKRVRPVVASKSCPRLPGETKDKRKKSKIKGGRK